MRQHRWQAGRSIAGLAASGTTENAITRNAVEEPAVLLTRAVRRLVMNGMPRLRSEAKLKVGEEPRESVGPGSFEERVMLTPKDPRRDADWRGERGNALDDGHTTRVIAQIPVEPPLEVSRLHEVVYPHLEFVVKCVLAVSPVAQERMNVDPACAARRTDQLGDPRHLMEELIPRFQQVARFYPPGSDVRVCAVEEKEPGNPLGRPPGDHLGDEVADVMGRQANALESERIREREGICSQGVRGGVPRGGRRRLL
jgi:hypothetical protein